MMSFFSRPLGIAIGILILAVTVLFLYKTDNIPSFLQDQPKVTTDSTLITSLDTVSKNHLLTDTLHTKPIEFKDLTLDDLLLVLDTAQFMKYASYGFCLRDVATGRIIKQRNIHQSVIPASVIKMITTGVALELAGSNYRFRTRLQYDGQLDVANRVLRGNIYIRGGGDPTLGSNVFSNPIKGVMRHWKKAIQDLGIDSIQGAIVGDARFFEYEMIPSGWNWADVKSDYGAGVSGLSFRENTFDLYIRNGAVFKISPKIPDLQIFGKLSVAKNTSKSYIMLSGAPYDGKRLLQGQVRGGRFKERCPMPDPAYTCAHTLWKTLQRDSLFVRDSATTVLKLKRSRAYKNKPRHDFYTTNSPQLKHLIRHTNLVSQNFYAETLFKLIGVKGKGYGSSEAASKAMRAFWERKKMNIKGFWQTDGSGLSRTNAITPQLLSDMLIYFQRDSVHFQDYYNSLAIAGKTGTMSKLCIGTVAEDNLRAKSGTMGRVKAYAGYVHDQKQRLLTFVMISNNHLCTASEMRKHFEGLMIKIAELDSSGQDEAKN